MLLVEDEETLAALVARGLTERGDVVDVVGTWAEALTSAPGGDHDVILLDIRLPDRDGFEVCRRLRTDRSCPAPGARRHTGYPSAGQRRSRAWSNAPPRQRRTLPTAR